MVKPIKKEKNMYNIQYDYFKQKCSDENFDLKSRVITNDSLKMKLSNMVPASVLPKKILNVAIGYMYIT